MSKDGPIRLDFSLIRENIMNFRGFIAPDFAVSDDVPIFANKVITFGQPYRLPEARLFLLVDGELDAMANLVDLHIVKGDIVYVGAGSIIQINNRSDHLIIMAVAMKEELMRMVLNVNRMTVFDGDQSQILIHAESEDFAIMCDCISTLLKIVHQKDYSMDVVKNLYGAIYFNFDRLVTQQKHDNNQNRSREREVFNHFITLVRRHYHEERKIKYYACHLFLSERYLSSLIKKASGKTAKEWIETAVVTEAKVLLKHSNYSITQITDTLHFPNNSFFCKFFKRLTGMSPITYKKSE